MILPEIAEQILRDYAAEQAPECWVVETALGPCLASHNQAHMFLFRERVLRHVKNTAAVSRAWKTSPASKPNP